MGRPKEYTPEALAKKVDRYFRSITRVVPVTERKETGIRDDKGHMTYETVPVINALGKEMTITEYIIPPSVGDLADFLGIHRSTWDNYCDQVKHPEFFDTTTRARGRIHAYLERESLTRQGKDLKGVLFNLENNFGYKEKVEVSGGIEDYLRRLEEDGGGQQF